MGMIAKSKRPEAERAGEWFLREKMGCVVTRRALRTKFAKVDFYAADIIGKREDGSCVYAQVTAGGSEALRVRRRKLEKVPWHWSEDVLLLQMQEKEFSGRGKKWEFRVHVLLRGDEPNNPLRTQWEVQSVEEIDKKWFKAFKEVDDGTMA